MIDRDAKSRGPRPNPQGRDAAWPGTGGPPPHPLAAVRARQKAWQSAVVVLLAAACLVGPLLVLRAAPQPPATAAEAAQHRPEAGPVTQTFRGWGKPEVAIVLSGQQDGYLMPCGCSRPQYGGLSRRYNFIASLRDKGWPVVALDLGDVAAEKGNPQRKLKYATSMKALKVMGYTAVAVGGNEMSIPLIDALAEYTLNDHTPKVLAANLLGRKPGELFDTLVHDVAQVRPDGGPAVGVIGLVGRSTQEKVKDPDVAFDQNNATVIQRALADLKGKSAVTVLLYQGSAEDAHKCAQFCAGLRRQDPQLPTLDLILCLSRESEPPAVPDLVDGTPTRVITVGHKGRYVGVVGVYPTQLPGRYDFRYQLVSIGPGFETPEGKEADNPVAMLMAQYATTVKNAGYLTQFRTHLHEVQAEFPDARYVGSERCAGCHPSAYKVWEGSKHAHAYQTLVDVKHPPFRQFDAECVQCHVVGFEHPSGYLDAVKDGNERKLARLQNVGCESCHGPGSEHVADTHNPRILSLINPWKVTPQETDPNTPEQVRTVLQNRRVLKIDTFCQKCHDTDNDVHWKFSERWPEVIHPMTPEEARELRKPAPVGNNPAGPEARQDAQPSADGPKTDTRFRPIQRIFNK